MLPADKQSTEAVVISEIDVLPRLMPVGFLAIHHQEFKVEVLEGIGLLLWSRRPALVSS